MTPKINVIQKLTPKTSKIQGEEVLQEGWHYHIEQEDDDTWSVILHHEEDRK